MKRQHLKKREIRALEESMRAAYGQGMHLPRKACVERLEIKGIRIIGVERKPWFFFPPGEEGMIPTLHFLLERQILTEIAIDMPAIPYIINGADIMRPGIVRFGEGIEEGDTVCIVDEQHHKPLAVGRALLSGPEMEAKSSGKVVKNLHHVGDEVWNASF